MRHDGSSSGAHPDKVFQQHGKAALKAVDNEGPPVTFGYWLAELTVPQHPS
jgi:hypothetical protein